MVKDGMSRGMSYQGVRVECVVTDSAMTALAMKPR